MAEKKNNRRKPAGEGTELPARQQDQVPQRGGGRPRRSGKIAGPRQKPAAQRGKAKEAPAQAPEGEGRPRRCQAGEGPGQDPPGPERPGGGRRPEGESGRGRQARGKKQTLGHRPPSPRPQQARAAKQAQAQEKAQAQKKGRGRQKKIEEKPPIRAYFLGGLNEIGKNFTLYECQDDNGHRGLRHGLPRRGDAGGRPGHPRLHLRGEEPLQDPGRGHYPRPRGPHRRGALPAEKAERARVRHGPHHRPHRGEAEGARPHRLRPAAGHPARVPPADGAAWTWSSST